MRRPEWASSRVARRWFVAGAVVALFLAGRTALPTFEVEATLSDGARAYASCSGPWRSARADPPVERFTFWAVIGGTGELRHEAVATLGARCRSGARARLAVAGLALAASGVLTWLALPRSRPHRGGRPQVRSRTRASAADSGAQTSPGRPRIWRRLPGSSGSG